MKKIFLFLFLSGAFISCENSVESDILRLKAPTVSVENVISSSNSVSLIAIASWHDGCGKFSHYTSSSNGNDISVTVYAQIPTESACPAVMTSFEAPVEVVIEGPGDYNLSFWQTDSTSLDTTITVL
ncbi:MAG: hypothetical protein PF445_08730 [Melioribacteraceae bacterium]|jgi:hypothetical protein|nr:hypothetical protein [Melioribacteraceae bacterium]